MRRLKKIADITRYNVISVKSALVGDKTDELAEKRLAICVKCPLYHKLLDGVLGESNPHAFAFCNQNDEITVNGKKVKGCGCRLDAKVRDESQECPAGKW